MNVRCCCSIAAQSIESVHFLVRPLQEYYIIAPGHIYQSPDVASVISHRLVDRSFVELHDD